MNRLFLYFLAVATFVPLLDAAEPEPVVKGRIVSIGVFKNGLLAVREEITLPSPGRYTLSDAPRSIHGTFFVESDAALRLTASLRDTVVGLDGIGSLDPVADLAGRKIIVTLDKSEPFEAVILPTSKKAGPEEEPLFAPHSSRLDYVGARLPNDQVVLKKADGAILVTNRARISSLEIPAGTSFDGITRKRPTLVLDAKGESGDKRPITVVLTSLTRGMTWAPSYRIRLGKEGKAQIEQAVVLVNQWRKLTGVPVALVSGYPQIEFQNAESPLWPELDMARFFRSLSRHAGENGGIAMTQQIMSNSAMPDFNAAAESPAPPAGEGPDLYFQPAGKITLDVGEREFFTQATETTDYERLVYWNIRDTRDESGHTVQQPRRLSYATTTSGEMETDDFGRYSEPWDVVRFVNPFAFPVTTAPVSVYDGERFVGQSATNWISPGDRATVAVNKALSLRVESKEEEIVADEPTPSGTPGTASAPAKNVQAEQAVPIVGPGGESLMQTIKRTTSIPGVSGEPIPYNAADRPLFVVLNGSRYRVAVVEASIHMTNNRKERVKTVVRRRFSGELVEGTQTPPDSIVTTTDAGRGVNRLQEATWNVEIAPGKSIKRVFRYRVLVAI